MGFEKELVSDSFVPSFPMINFQNNFSIFSALLCDILSVRIGLRPCVRFCIPQTSDCEALSFEGGFRRI